MPDRLATAVLVAHVASATLGLLLAGPVVLAPKPGRGHVLGGRVYALAAAVMCLSALVLVAADPARLAGLGVIALLTLGCVVGGVATARSRRLRRRIGRGWRVVHLNLMGSSVISFVTAFAVQQADGHWAAWVLPTVVGSPLIARRTAAERRRLARPRARPPAPGLAVGALSPIVPLARARVGALSALVPRRRAGVGALSALVPAACARAWRAAVPRVPATTPSDGQAVPVSRAASASPSARPERQAVSTFGRPQPSPQAPTPAAPRR